ncbi:hypothetical protein KDK77_08875, partial [bacterium]|nr:hypothetical protein [bacterium]
FPSIESVFHSFFSTIHEKTLLYDMQESATEVNVYIFGKLENKTDSAEFLSKIMSKAAGKKCSIDFSHCISIGNAGLKMLIDLHDALAEQGENCVLNALNDRCRQMLCISKIDTMFTIAKK